MIYILFSLTLVVTYMLGGQFGSAWRKYGGMAAIILLVIWRSLHGGIWWHLIPLLIICPVLFAGYGEKSWLMKFWSKVGTPLANEDEVRLAYAVMLGIPLIIVSPLNGLLATSVIVFAFMVRAGGFKIGGKDFLWEDFMRSMALALGIVVVTL